jgi:hypothetical protein
MAITIENMKVCARAQSAVWRPTSKASVNAVGSFSRSKLITRSGGAVDVGAHHWSLCASNHTPSGRAPAQSGGNGLRRRLVQSSRQAQTLGAGLPLLTEPAAHACDARARMATIINCSHGNVGGMPVLSSIVPSTSMWNDRSVRELATLTDEY